MPSIFASLEILFFCMYGICALMAIIFAAMAAVRSKDPFWKRGRVLSLWSSGLALVIWVPIIGIIIYVISLLVFVRF